MKINPELDLETLARFTILNLSLAYFHNIRNSATPCQLFETTLLQSDGCKDFKFLISCNLGRYFMFLRSPGGNADLNVFPVLLACYCTEIKLNFTVPYSLCAYARKIAQKNL